MDKYISGLGISSGEGCCKIFHGPSGILPGLESLIIDKLAYVIFAVTYETFLPEDLSDLVGILEKNFPGSFIRIQERGNGPAREVFVSGAMPDSLIVSEGEARFYIHPGRGQNIGFFPDMVNGRKRIGTYIKEENPGGTVLNLFSYTCSFSVTALLSGAERVDNWDMNRNSLNIGKKNHELNGLDPRQKASRYFAYDIFKSLGKVRKNGPYDLIIMDPPPFQGGSFSYKRDYPKLIRRTGEWLKEGGACLFCLNASETGWMDFREMINGSLPGSFRNWEESHPPSDYIGKHSDKGLKSYLLTGWELS